MTPLIVTAHLSRGVVPSPHSRSIYFDGVLAYATLMREGKWRPTGKIISPAIPLQCLWRDEQDKPLWAASKMQVNNPAHSMYYRHRRWVGRDMDWCKKRPGVIETMTGRYKNRRISYTQVIPPDGKVYWMCVGDKKEISDLLKTIPSIGKHFSCYGTVLRWEVEENNQMKNPTDTVASLRPTPKQSELNTTGPEKISTWTPPYWYQPWAEPCHVGG